MINSEREKKINQLKKLKILVKELSGKYGLEMDELIDKIERAISNLEQSKFIVAVFGAFSDGKSTILSAITKNFNIKISPEPTTDKIVEYPYGEFVFIDTPGIFSDNLMHDEKTKKFISEANIIIFVCDAVNPVKQSHLPLLRWLFKELGKLDVTIFVINKMDLVVSLKDDYEFGKMAEIKKNVLLETLKEIMNIEIEVPVLCIASNPYDLGLDYWKTNWTEYEKLSRIGTLIEKINQIYGKYKEQLMIKAGISVIKESLISSLHKLKKAQEIANERFKINKNLVDELELKMKALEYNIRTAYEQYKQELINLRENILLKIDATNEVDELIKVVEIELGREGEVLKSKIETCISRAISPLNDSIFSFNKEIDFTISNALNLDERVVTLISSSIVKVSDKILSFSKRELMSKLLKVRREYGLNKVVKFRTPGEHMIWASKWANKLQKAATIGKSVGPILETLFIIKAIYDRVKFNEKKNKIKEEIHSIFKEFIKISYEEFVNTSAKYVEEYDRVLSDVKKQIERDEMLLNDMTKYILSIEHDLGEFKYLPERLSD